MVPEGRINGRVGAENRPVDLLSNHVQVKGHQVKGIRMPG